MGFGGLIGKGVKGLEALLGEGLESFLGRPASTLPPMTRDQLLRVADEFAAASREYSPQSIDQLSEMGRLGSAKRADPKQRAVYRTAEEAEDFDPVYDAAESYSARAAGTESDPFGIDPATGKPVYTKFAGTGPTDLGQQRIKVDGGAREVTLRDYLFEEPTGAFPQKVTGRGQFEGLEALSSKTGERSYQDLKRRGSGTGWRKVSRTTPQKRGDRFESGLETEGGLWDEAQAIEQELIEKFKKGEITSDQYEAAGGLPPHLRALRYNIEDSFIERVTLEDGKPVAGYSYKLEQGGEWERQWLTQEQATKAFEDGENLVGRLNTFSKEDWKFVDSALNEAMPRKWSDAKRLIGRKSRLPLQYEWNKTGIDWRGQESLVLRDVLKAVDNSIEATVKGASIDDPRDWYHMGQLHDDYRKTWGDLLGTRLFLDFTNMIGATTASARPHSNFSAGSYYDWLNYHKQLFTGQPIQTRKIPSGKGYVVKKVFRADLLKSGASDSVANSYLRKSDYEKLRKILGQKDNKYVFDGMWKNKDGDYVASLFLGHKVWTPAQRKQIQKEIPKFWEESGRRGLYTNPNLAPAEDLAIQPYINAPSLTKTTRLSPEVHGRSGYFKSLSPGVAAGAKGQTTQEVMMKGLARGEWLERLLSGALQVQGKEGGETWLEASQRFRLDPLQAQKGAHFAAALSGNLQAVTLDQVMSNALALRAPLGGEIISAPDNRTYTYIQEFIQDIARGYDVDPAAMQALQWVGTPMKDVSRGGLGASAIRTYDERLRVTAAIINKTVTDESNKVTPKQVNELFIRKVIPLLGLVPAMNLGLIGEIEGEDSDET